MAAGDNVERREDISQIATDVAQIKIDAGVAAALLKRLESGDLCPYRELIQQASNNHLRLITVEKQTQTNRVGIAKMLISSSIGGAIVALAELLLVSH